MRKRAKVSRRERERLSEKRESERERKRWTDGQCVSVEEIDSEDDVWTCLGDHLHPLTSSFTTLGASAGWL